MFSHDTPPPPLGPRGDKQSRHVSSSASKFDWYVARKPPTNVKNVSDFVTCRICTFLLYSKRQRASNKLDRRLFACGGVRNRSLVRRRWYQDLTRFIFSAFSLLSICEIRFQSVRISICCTRRSIVSFEDLRWVCPNLFSKSWDG